MKGVWGRSPRSLPNERGGGRNRLFLFCARLCRRVDRLEHQARFPVYPTELFDACNEACEGYLIARRRLLLGRQHARRQNDSASPQFVGVRPSHRTASSPTGRELSTAPLDRGLSHPRN